jgi:hypothetical protein
VHDVVAFWPLLDKQKKYRAENIANLFSAFREWLLSSSNDAEENIRRGILLKSIDSF